MENIFRHIADNRRMHQCVHTHDVDDILLRLLLRGGIQHHQRWGMPLDAFFAGFCIGNCRYGAALTLKLLHKGGKNCGPLCLQQNGAFHNGLMPAAAGMLGGELRQFALAKCLHGHAATRRPGGNVETT